MTAMIAAANSGFPADGCLTSGTLWLIAAPINSALEGGASLPVHEANISSASPRPTSGFLFSHLIQPPSPYPASSLTNFRCQPDSRSPSATMDESFRDSCSDPSHLWGEIQKVKPRPLSFVPMMMESISVSTQTASSPSTCEMMIETSRAMRSTSITRPGSRLSPARKSARGTPSTHSVTRKGMPSIGSTEPVMTDRRESCERVDRRSDAASKARASSFRSPPPSSPKGKNLRSATVRPRSLSWARNTTPCLSCSTMSSIWNRLISVRSLVDYWISPSGIGDSW